MHFDLIPTEPDAIEHDFFTLAMDHVPNPVFVKDEFSNIVYANKAFKELYPPAMRTRIIGYTGVEHFPEEQVKMFLEEDRIAFQKGRSELVEHITSYDGVHHTFHTRKIRFQDSIGRPRMLGICDDITELAEREQQLVQANGALENFASLAAHDLRSPLASFVSVLTAVRDDPKNTLQETSRNYLDMTIRSAQHLGQHIAGLLATFKASSKRTLERKRTDLNLMLEEVKFNLSLLVEDQGAQIYATRLPTLAVDAHLLRHLFHNLIENSIKYRSDRKPTITIRYEQKPEGHLFIFEDNGYGITAENEKRIFRLYEQGDGNTASGLGIGLSLCKKIVELHGGKIWVDHNHAPGCRMCFTMPEETPDAAPNTCHIL